MVVDRIRIILYNWGHRGGIDGFSTQVPACRTFSSPGCVAPQRSAYGFLLLLLQIVGYLSAGMVFTCSAANNLVYFDRGTMQAAGAGHIILSIVQVCTALRFAGEECPKSCLFVYRSSGSSTLDRVLTRHLTPMSILSLSTRIKSGPRAPTRSPRLTTVKDPTRVPAVTMRPRCILVLS